MFMLKTSEFARFLGRGESETKTDIVNYELYICMFSWFTHIVLVFMHACVPQTRSELSNNFQSKCENKMMIFNQIECIHFLGEIGSRVKKK